ncbi:MAG TPA: SPFH domain-containing protein [Anaerolineaceae bacterium]|jgi:regulator of protease activity HflC (stomatin/prohibitin superfamily)|nr:SPFH domain-containing protein [Anaerolineaceae bacterium]
MNIAILVQWLATFAWIGLVGFFVYLLVRAAQHRPMPRGGLGVLIIGAIAVLLTTVASGLVFINPDERGVVISAVTPEGYRTQPLHPGLRWIIPFAETVVRYPISRQTYTMSIAPSEGMIQGDDSIEARTADGQKIYVDASVIYSIAPDDVVNLHILWGNRYSAELLRPLVRGAIRDAVSQYGVEEVVTSKRAEVVAQINETMSTSLGENGIILVDFILRNITYTDEYAASVEQKQIAEQLAQQAVYVVEQRKQEAEQARQVAQGQADAAVIAAQGAADARIIQAEAEAQALELIADALKDRPELLTYQYITKISPNIEVMFLPSNAPFIFPLPDTQAIIQAE